jgi:hypothetical protein
LLCKVFHENKKLNLELKRASSEIASLRSAHDDMSAKPCDNYNMIMVNYADLWLMHSHVAILLDGARLELRELKAHSTLLGVCTTCPLLRSNLEVAAIEIKDLKNKLDHSSHYTILSPPCEACVPLKGKLIHATKENIKLHQEVPDLTARLDKTILSEKMIVDDLSRVKEGATKPIKTHYPSNPKPSFNPKREERKKNPKPREEAFVCMFCGCAGHFDEFCFRRKRIERRCVDYARNSYRDDFIDLPPRSYSHIPPHSYSRASPHTFLRALSHFSHGPNHRSYGFGSRENRFEPRRFGYDPRPHRGDHFPRRTDFPAGGSYTHLEPRHLDDPRFLHRGSCPTRQSGEVQRTVKTFSGRMFKCWIPKIYLTNPSTESSTFSHPM